VPLGIVRHSDTTVVTGDKRYTLGQRKVRYHPSIQDKEKRQTSMKGTRRPVTQNLCRGARPEEEGARCGGLKQHPNCSRELGRRGALIGCEDVCSNGVPAVSTGDVIRRFLHVRGEQLIHYAADEEVGSKRYMTHGSVRR
jgi:hypothetical protein